MVELIGVAVVVALSWVLASTMATESDSEKRRSSLGADESSSTRDKTGGTRAA